MHWASSRHTTREEDEVYCLLGILKINMSLLYGEGKRAFRRLQEEIMKTTADQSILAWEIPAGESALFAGLLAHSTSCFRGAARNVASTDSVATTPGSEFRLTHQGLEIELWLEKYRLEQHRNYHVTALDCILQQPEGHSHRVGLLLELTSS
jgi:hypothetical protein